MPTYRRNITVYSGFYLKIDNDIEYFFVTRKKKRIESLFQMIEQYLPTSITSKPQKERYAFYNTALQRACCEPHRDANSISYTLKGITSTNNNADWINKGTAQMKIVFLSE